MKGEAAAGRVVLCCLGWRDSPPLAAGLCNTRQQRSAQQRPARSAQRRRPLLCKELKGFLFGPCLLAPRVPASARARPARAVSRYARRPAYLPVPADSSWRAYGEGEQGHLHTSVCRPVNEYGLRSGRVSSMRQRRRNMEGVRQVFYHRNETGLFFEPGPLCCIQLLPACTAWNTLTNLAASACGSAPDGSARARRTVCNVSPS